MRPTHEVKLPAGRFPKFPSRCVVCGEERPTSAVKLSAHAFEWWMVLLWWTWFLFEGHSYAIPACTPCARRFMRQYRVRFLVELGLFIVAIVVSIYLVRGIPRPWQKWAGIGIAFLLLLPLLSWKVIWPMAVQISADRSMLEFEFIDPEYAEEFAALNIPQPVNGESLSEEESPEQTAENEQLTTLFNEGRLDAMVTIVENRLNQIHPSTPFHAVIGKNFLHQVDAAADWLAAFHDDSAKVFRPADIYVEMNRFDINFDRWYVEAYARMEVPQTSEEWDSDVSAEFVLTGMEDMQKAMEDYRTLETSTDRGEIASHLRDAQGDAFFLVMLHMQILIKHAWLRCGERGHPVGGIRVSAGVHDDSMTLTAQPDELAALASAGGRSTLPPKYVNRPEYQLKYPDDWRADVDDMYHDIGGSGTIHLTLVGPGGAFMRLDVYNEAALVSPDELTASVARIHWEREEVIPPTDVKARALKLIREDKIVGPVAKRFDRWGQYRGEGLRITGRIKSVPVSVAVFTAKAGPWSLVVSEQCMDHDLPRCTAGFDFIRSTFRFGSPDDQVRES